jgi:hypothetical protein
MRFEAARNNGKRIEKVDGSWNDASEARAAVYEIYLSEHPSGAHTFNWRDNSEQIRQAMEEGRQLFPIYSLYCNGFFTGYTVIDNVSYNEQAKRAQKMTTQVPKNGQLGGHVMVGDIDVKHIPKPLMSGTAPEQTFLANMAEFMTPGQIRQSNEHHLRKTIDCGCCDIDELIFQHVNAWCESLYEGELLTKQALSDANAAYLFTNWYKRGPS